ncbi:MAG: type IV toxin-antitoxin system AbiEi family antitoxin domain-containing protein [Solirubrobacteraceae bacterium]
MAVGGNFRTRGEAKRSQLLAQLMRSQSGVIGLEQLRALGLTKAEVAGMVGRRELWRVHRGVYADTRSPMTPRGHLFAALLSFTPDAHAFFSHRTAAALLGLRDLSVHRLELTIVADHTPKRPPLRVHRVCETPPAHEIRTRDGITFSSAARMLVELAPRETGDELNRLITAAARKRLLDPQRVERALAHHAGARGIAPLRAALAAYRPTRVDKSGFERDFAEWLTTDDRIPPPQRNVVLGGWELDFYWPDHGVVVETDGERFHMLPGDRERDYRKDAWLQRRRIAVLRVGEFRFAHDRQGVRDDLLGLLGLD